MKILSFSWDKDLDQMVKAKAAELGDVVTLDMDALPDDDSFTLAAAAAKVIEQEGVDLALLGASKRGKDVAPRLAALVGWPYAAEVQDIEKTDDGWSVSRMVLSGNSKATYNMGPNAVCTATAKTFESPDAGEPEKVAIDVDGSPVKIVGTKGEGDQEFDLAGAPIVIGVGRGFKEQEDIKLAEELAACFPGGAVGCSRPVAADLKWLGEEHWIGLSGHEIKPKMYLAAGVSGQIQHIAGIRGAKLIVAVNTNKDAPIFSVADYGVVGDLYKVLPALTEALKAKQTA